MRNNKSVSRFLLRTFGILIVGSLIGMYICSTVAQYLGEGYAWLFGLCYFIGGIVLLTVHIVDELS